MNERTPDVAEYIIAWRMWRYCYEYENGKKVIYLRSLGLWPKRGKLVASCPNNNLDVPCENESSHHCGIYAYKSLFNTTKEFQTKRKQKIYVYGEVALWGKIVVHTLGYRAQFAYPLRLYCDKKETTAVLASEYGIPLIPMFQRRIGDEERTKLSISWDQVLDLLKSKENIKQEIGEMILKKMAKHVKKCGLCQVPNDL